MKTFEEFLKNIHAEVYRGTDDAMSEHYNDWLCEIESDRWIRLADEFAGMRHLDGYTDGMNSNRPLPASSN